MFTFLVFLFIVCSAREPLPDQTDDQFQNECLEHSNKYRSKHSAPPLQIDDQIIEYAESRCQHVSQYRHLKEGKAGLLKEFGENLFRGSGDGLRSCSHAIHSWYKEIEHYDFNAPGTSSKTGHFTQLVWKSSIYVGCARCGGIIDSGKFETYIVCNYKPPGNYEDEFADNVLQN